MADMKDISKADVRGSFPERVRDSIMSNFGELFNVTKPKSGVTFTGAVNLSRLSTIYNSYTMSTNLVLSIASGSIAGGGAEVTLVADGTHTPDLTAFTKGPTSEDWDTTLNKQHKCVFYYDGTTYYYSLSYLN